MHRIASYINLQLGYTVYISFITESNNSMYNKIFSVNIWSENTLCYHSSSTATLYGDNTSHRQQFIIRTKMQMTHFRYDNVSIINSFSQIYSKWQASTISTNENIQFPACPVLSFLPYCVALLALKLFLGTLYSLSWIQRHQLLGQNLIVRDYALIFL